MSRHEAGWVPDTTPGYQGQHRADDHPDPRDELEAGFWTAYHAHEAKRIDRNAFIERLLSLADAYASSDSERLTELRRQVLHKERPDIGGERT